ncbi:Anaphase-promoting complex subunit 2 [Schistosoma japonicum]|uniref:Anaphase-promoting complex subunit 2 n=1 Tax=Schistosoma japonicum TaxID=6182 RepID=A0A4Z2CRX6_SCHJA|nr:Anaphase-promoting complex subunit 2 [Schistosoma japonicum]TNN07030.1 Anaphase-promoting complex subunit 2 [Schistosoma japonicum]
MSCLLHDNLREVYGCDTIDSCFCKEIFFEQVVYFLQTSNLVSQLVSLVEECNSPTNISNTNLYHTLDEDNDFLRLLCLFIKLTDNLNKELNVYLQSIFKSGLELVMNNSKIMSEIQCIVTSVLSSLKCENLLQPIWHSYLCLELESAENDSEELNVFSTVICPNITDRKVQILSSARNLTHNNSLVSWSALYRHLCAPYIKEAISYRTKLLCSENYSEQFLNSIIKYKNCVLKKVLIPRLFSRKDDIREISTQLSDEIIYKTFYLVHKPDMFSLVIEYPDSVAALMDLGKCLDHLPIRQDLITHLTEEVQQRLLHPGVHTEQILAAYNYLVRALRLIDGTFLVQDIVCKPVSACLRQREDAVRCIVDKLISGPETDGDGEDEVKAEAYADTTTELHQELLLPKPLEVEPLDGGEDSDADIVSEDPPFDSEIHSTTLDKHFILESDWKPDPIEALCQRGSWRRKLDLLSMLVSIYGSKKAFLVEYKQLLSQRLLRQRSFHTARELRNLELLKLRFGEQNLHECEVMLKDIRDSKRIANLVSEAMLTDSERKHVDQTDKLPDSPIQVPNVEIESLDKTQSKVASLENKTTTPSVMSFTDATATSNNNNDKSVGSRCDIAFPLSAYILSIHYWPELLDDKFKIPEDFSPVFEHYEQCFQRLKGNRTLNWMHKLGLVNIDLTLGKRIVKIDVTPLQVSIIYLFTKQRTWYIRDLAQKLESQISTVRTGLYMFIQLGFLRLSDSRPDLYDNNHLTYTTSENLEVYEVCDETDTTESGEKLNNNLNCVNHSNDSGKIDTNTIETTNNWIFTSQDHSDSLVTSVRERKEKELQVFWSYITAMLTNLGSLSLDRIHSMLRMFALGSTSGLEFSKDELRRFLDRKIREGQLGCDGDVYKLIISDL